jgi:preprotein translocase subunit SecD
VQVEDVYASRMDVLWPEIRDALAAERDTVGFVTREEGAIRPAPHPHLEPRGRARAPRDRARPRQPVATLTGRRRLGHRGRGQRRPPTVQLSEAERAATDDRTVQQALEIVRRRIDEVGTREPTILRQGADRILVEVPAWDRRRRSRTSSAPPPSSPSSRC